MSRKCRWKWAALSALAGGLFSLGHAPFGWVLASLLGGVAQLFILNFTPSVRQSASVGWAFGLGYFGVALHWIVEPFLVDIARHGWMAPFALVILAAGLALFWGLAHGLARWIAPRGWAFVLFWAVALSAVELLRAYVFTGFPWALPAYIWVDHLLAQSVAWSGPYALTLLTFLMFGAVFLCLSGVLRGVWSAKIACLPVGVLVLTAVWLPAPLAQSGGQTAPVVRLIQPNAPQNEKWQSGKMQEFFDRSLALTQAEGAPDVIVWPETSVPVWLADAAGAFGAISNRAGEVPVVLGIQRRQEQRFFNTAVVIQSGRLRAQYDKSHLVPFGEYVPFGWVFSKMGIHGLAAQEGGGYSSGSGPVALELNGIGLVQPLICYEGIFPHLVGATPERVRLFLLITNDAWFGNGAGPRQHLVQAQFRAIEHATPMARAANTGISAMIDARGRIVGALALNTSGFIDLALPEQHAPTLYSKTGDAPLGGLLLFALVSGGVARRARRAIAAH